MVSGEQARLAVELEYYAAHKRDWLRKYSGNYVVVKESSVLGFYQNFELAYRAGATMYGISTDFLVKQVLEHDPVFFVF
jgi:hypothetical protein